MKRRTFVKYSSATSLAAVLGHHLEKKELIKKTPYIDTLGIQLWTVREPLSKDPVNTLKAIKQAGYEQVETMSLSQMVSLKPILNDVGLKVRCSHVANQVISGNWERLGLAKPENSKEDLIKLAVENELEHVTFAYWGVKERQSLDDYKRLTTQLNIFGDLCNTAGLTFSYHNHSFEFIPMEDTTPYDILLSEVDEDKMKMELDVFWCNIGGVSPIDLMTKLGDRIALLHLKDQAKGTSIQYDESKVAPSTYEEVGDGQLNFKSIIDLAVQNKVDYCHVEQDFSPDVLKSIVQSQNYLDDMKDMF